MIQDRQPVLYDNPAELGADRIVNWSPAFENFGGPCVVREFWHGHHI